MGTSSREADGLDTRQSSSVLLSLLLLFVTVRRAAWCMVSERAFFLCLVIVLFRATVRRVASWNKRELHYLNLIEENCRAGWRTRARSHCRFVLPLIHFIPDSLRYSVPLFLKRQCDRTLWRTGRPECLSPRLRARCLNARGTKPPARPAGGTHLRVSSLTCNPPCNPPYNPPYNKRE